MEMDASAQTMAAAPTVLVTGKKEMMAEARAAESKKRAARRVVAKQREKNKKLAEEKAKQAKILQSVHARATAEALAKKAVVHAIAMLKGEVVTEFTTDHFGSTASSVSSTAGG
jgi:membrane protein involved in colicin uptake